MIKKILLSSVIIFSSLSLQNCAYTKKAYFDMILSEVETPTKQIQTLKTNN